MVEPLFNLVLVRPFFLRKDHYIAQQVVNAGKFLLAFFWISTANALDYGRHCIVVYAVMCSGSGKKQVAQHSTRIYFALFAKKCFGILLQEVLRRSFLVASFVASVHPKLSITRLRRQCSAVNWYCADRRQSVESVTLNTVCATNQVPAVVF